MRSVLFFWKAGWAFVLGYFISAAIQVFVPKQWLYKNMGKPTVKSVSLASLAGAISSSCSFAALSAAKSLVKKGAHFIVAIAFMFASTNLVIELGVLIFIFLGWQYMAAEIIGGILLIMITGIIAKYTFPEEWMDQLRKRLGSEEAEGDFDWKKRMKSREGWYKVGKKFVDEWGMVWEEIVIGFTVAGIVAIAVPKSVWEAIFLKGSTLPQWLLILENALIAPFVAAATFIGSMGNIPLATVLAENGIFFAGIMAFIYSDLIVPPLVMVNIKYYGKKIAFYVAGIMYVGMVSTAIILHYFFEFFGILPQSSRTVAGVMKFEIDYTFWFNLIFIVIAIILFNLAKKTPDKSMDMDMGSDKGISIKRVVAIFSILFVAASIIASFLF